MAGHPAAFVTLTAPSFGLVHGRRADGSCRAASDRPVCAHGNPQYCNKRHARGDGQLGTALCVSCYDYTGHILWHASVPELWRRFTVELPRALARLSLERTGAHRTAREVGRTVRVSYVKVSEWQRRGAIHLHAVVRLDGRDADGEVIDPPGWVAVPGLLAAAVKEAAAAVRVGCPWPDGRERIARWGGQVHVRAVTDPARTAAYLAKYATKTASDSVPGLPVRTFDRLTIDRLRRKGVSWHYLLLAGTCLRLAEAPECEGLRLADFVHTFGYRGHHASKSRLYSTTMRALGAARRAWRAEQRGADVWAAAGADVAVVGDWRLVGVGHARPGDALLAERMAREEEAYKRAVKVHDVRRLVEAVEETEW
ncbi:hypothetical protein LO762_10670 [Actinocorallia sp. API 0066]|nr:hypothetical protein [Actinocorallia sp. API 0066]